jgi:hypothetical protein
MFDSWRRRTLVRALPSTTFALGLVLAIPRFASADERIDRLVSQLRSDDFRLRTQAALGLGSSGVASAVKPLCGATADGVLSVRLAVIAALGKLGKDEGRACLVAARAKESDAGAVKAIDQAIEKIALGGDPPPPQPGAKFYVALQVNNKTSRPAIEIEGLVRRSIQDHLIGNNVAVAPRSETPAQAKEVLGSKKLSGFLLVASVEPFAYRSGDLTVQLKVTLWTYPDKALKAEFGPKLTQQGTSPGDVDSENLLVSMAGETAAKSFVKVTSAL